jgi:hypothetical protein
MHAPVLRPEAFYLPEVETRFIPAGTALTVDLSKTCRVLYVEDAFDQARLLVQDKEWDLNELRPDTAYLPIEDDRDPSRVEASRIGQSVGADRVDLRPRMAQACARYWGRFCEFTEVEAFQQTRAPL